MAGREDAGPGSPCEGEMLTSPEVTGNTLPVVQAGGSPLAGAVNPAGPVAQLLQVAPLACVRRCLQALMRIWMR